MKLVSIAALYMAIGVACGAFGAHALRGVLSATDMAIWEKAVLYQLVHALAALVLVLNSNSSATDRRFSQVAGMFLLSVTVFSGSLYILVLTGQRWLGMITPLGGLGFIAAWLLLAFRCLNLRDR